MAYDDVEDYISDARVLLQDVIAPFRYDDPSLMVALNVTLLEAGRLRPDLFLVQDGSGTFNFTIPQYSLTVDDDPVPIENTFRLAIVHGVCAHALARDQEDIQDGRASAFMAIFNRMLVGSVQAPVPYGGGGSAQPAQGPNK